MNSRALLIALFILLNISLIDAQLGDSWYSQVDELNSQRATINCTFPEEYNKADREYWILPNGTQLRIPSVNGRFQVEDDGNLTINTVQKLDLGVYYCVFTNDTNIRLIKRGININGPYFISTWSVYRKSTIIGCSAFGGYIFLALCTALLYRFRWQGDKEDEDPYNFNGEINQAYLRDIPIERLGPPLDKADYDTTRM
ncbi:DgyrCDS3628 [Dimorphilus gyrociliatus]|uniref:DgyrCDS3628 n=1 Tax=Dimorphilus gyrociliatus TaxID=2664684 RepID=A0A7I8VDQ7_9ANNE|nr:DgyrCDS3628 [Dimorphilus gyrociliatus]